jgi:hypothetical protein
MKKSVLESHTDRYDRFLARLTNSIEAYPENELAVLSTTLLFYQCTVLAIELMRDILKYKLGVVTTDMDDMQVPITAGEYGIIHTDDWDDLLHIYKHALEASELDNREVARFKWISQYGMTLLKKLLDNASTFSEYPDIYLPQVPKGDINEEEASAFVASADDKAKEWCRTHAPASLRKEPEEELLRLMYTSYKHFGSDGNRR